MASQPVAALAGLFQATESLLAPEPSLPSALLMLREPRALAACRNVLDELGYVHHVADAPRHALDLVARDNAIQIVIADVDLPSLSGFSLIEEARLRAGDTRPVAAIMLVDEVCAESAMRCLHADAVDLLARPLARDACAAAMRRAHRYLSARRPLDHSANGIADFGDRIARLVSALETRGNERPATTSDEQLSLTLRAIISARSQRTRHFPSEIFADPAWDILLDLTRAQIDNQHVSVSSVCIAASVPMSTALRWVRQMTEAGLLHRWTDPKDRRRDLIALTPSTATNMREYLSAVATILRRK